MNMYGSNLATVFKSSSPEPNTIAVRVTIHVFAARIIYSRDNSPNIDSKKNNTLFSFIKNSVKNLHEMKVFKDYLVALVVVSATAEHEVLGWILGSGKVLLGFFHQGFLSNSHGAWFCNRLMSIGSPPIK